MKSIIITGANSGIGFACAMHMARIAPNEQIILACRNKLAGDKAIETIQQETNHQHLICLPLNLASLQSIKAFKTGISKFPTPVITTLVNNAGGQFVGETDYTKDGFEITFGTNHLGGFYLTLLLLPFIDENGSIVFTASGTHNPKQKTGMPAPEFKSPKLLAHPVPTTEKLLKVGQVRYTTSKLCNVLTTYELQRRLSNTTIRVNAFDPGLVPGTGLARNNPPILKFVFNYIFKIMLVILPKVAHTAKKSGRHLAELAYADQFINTKGKYLERSNEIKSSEESYNENYQVELWKGSVELTGISQKDTTVMLT